MRELMKGATVLFLLLILCLTHATAVLAWSDEIIQRDIEAEIAESERLAHSRIAVHVEQRLVVLTGEVRSYEQNLISERIAWTTMSVFEVDNEIRVMPRLPLSDMAIERKVREIVKANERFRAAGVVVVVSEGRVSLKGSFLDFSDPSTPRHAVAEIEGAVHIDMHAVFPA